MYILNVPINKNGKPEFATHTVYNVKDYPYQEILQKAEYAKRNGTLYFNIPAAFDIETTNLPDVKIAFMYQWQLCIQDKVCFGRTWEEWIEFLDNLRKYFFLGNKQKLVIYVHNLPYEWEFMRRFQIWDRIVLMGKRKPLWVESDGIIFRCSYKLSNMNLGKFCENSPGCTHYKLEDTYDYEKIRTPKTPLTEEEEAYCFNDVYGLCECIAHRLKSDDIISIPLTATGYVRRDMRQRLYADKQAARRYRDSMLSAALDATTYKICRNAFRGGDTHAFYYYSGKELENLHSKDMTSAYPFRNADRTLSIIEILRQYVCEGADDRPEQTAYSMACLAETERLISKMGTESLFKLQ